MYLTYEGTEGWRESQNTYLIVNYLITWRFTRSKTSVAALPYPVTHKRGGAVSESSSWHEILQIKVR